MTDPIERKAEQDVIAAAEAHADPWRQAVTLRATEVVLSALVDVSETNMAAVDRLAEVRQQGREATCRA